MATTERIEERVATLREIQALAREKAKEYGPLGAAALTSFLRDLQDMINRDLLDMMERARQ